MPGDYGWRHQKARKAAHAAFVPGTPCAFCGLPMDSGQELDLDHEIPRLLGGDSGPTRLVHRSCNRKAGRRLQAVLIQAAANCPRCREIGLDHARAGRRSTPRGSARWNL